jgi:tryptophan-rich sensory protein
MQVKNINSKSKTCYALMIAMAKSKEKRNFIKADENAKTNWAALAASIIICTLAGAIGSPFTFPAIPTWYATLSKPFFSPPNWVFGPVWTMLYILMGISAYLIWQHGWKKKQVRFALFLFGMQLFLNALWSILFFGLRSPFYGLLCIIPLWICIALCIRAFYPIERWAAYLLVPYLLWVSFATILNAAIWMLN